ncbi:glycosyltransferase family 2 protein [Hyunsoonleella rubra]|uniref:Glycosyltransferase family 2 protein n=1 Tax=Hyunsoonleella rubra TaxID=1737062 RepID=A0ABW5TDP3_9FLAO
MNSGSNVTVVIPCFNDGEYIMEAVNSVLNQTLKPEKIIIVDDGSDTHTKHILGGINDDSVEVVYQDNSGVCKARNVAIDLAKTDYILTLDADDYFEPTFIEKAVAILSQDSHVGIVGCFYRRLVSGKIQNEVVKPLGGGVSNFLVKNNGLGCSLFRKKCWEEVSGYDENMRKGYEDWDFWISILKNGWQMHIKEEPLFLYRKSKSSRDENAFLNHDVELRDYLFKKHRQVFMDNFEAFASQIIYSNSKLKQTQLKIKNSIDYRLGNLILRPFRLVKHIFKSQK